MNNTYSGQTTGALTNGGAAADQPNDEEQSPHDYDDDSGDQGVHILEEVVVVVVCDEYIGANVTQYSCSRLWDNRTDGRTWVEFVCTAVFYHAIHLNAWNIKS